MAGERLTPLPDEFEEATADELIDLYSAGNLPLKAFAERGLRLVAQGFDAQAGGDSSVHRTAFNAVVKDKGLEMRRYMYYRTMATGVPMLEVVTKFVAPSIKSDHPGYHTPFANNMVNGNMLEERYANRKVAISLYESLDAIVDRSSEDPDASLRAERFRTLVHLEKYANFCRERVRDKVTRMMKTGGLRPDNRTARNFWELQWFGDTEPGSEGISFTVQQYSNAQHALESIIQNLFGKNSETAYNALKAILYVRSSELPEQIDSFDLKKDLLAALAAEDVGRVDAEIRNLLYYFPDQFPRAVHEKYGITQEFLREAAEQQAKRVQDIHTQPALEGLPYKYLRSELNKVNRILYDTDERQVEALEPYLGQHFLVLRTDSSHGRTRVVPRIRKIGQIKATHAPYIENGKTQYIVEGYQVVAPTFSVTGERPRDVSYIHPGDLNREIRYGRWLQLGEIPSDADGQLQISDEVAARIQEGMAVLQASAEDKKKK